MVRQAILHVTPSSLLSLVLRHSPMVCGSTGRNSASHQNYGHATRPGLTGSLLNRDLHHAHPWSTHFQPLGATIGQCEVCHPPLFIISDNCRRMFKVLTLARSHC
ncbi:hypothetical protein B0J13DRAFT_139879 [Dactylonectria estremocensis]|uniref:Uncharacterized protein n=1 Tax=Dactylonectria estremocensis TaxID=1079267 RepID=A0A9P9E1C3_9HYPO|nr:hypothetical protein B0J13DRAFT_139879 [Dactylonectria estremocensis]